MTSAINRVAVIAGAGAAYASNPKAPLTNSLVARLEKAVTFDPSAVTIVDYLKFLQMEAPSGNFNFEAALAKAHDEVNLSPSERDSGFMALRFALWGVIKEFGYGLPDLYRDFVARLRASGQVHRELFVLTPNYDVMLDRAIQDRWTGSTHQGNAVVQHPHGAINKTLTCDLEVSPVPIRKTPRSRTAQSRAQAFTQLRREILDLCPDGSESWRFGAELPVPKSFEMRDELTHFGITTTIRRDGKPVDEVGPRFQVPALELPLAEKEGSRWVDVLWPEEDQEIARDYLARASHVLVIGWAGGDRHIADLVRDSVSSQSVSHVVSHDRVESERLASILDLSNVELFDGFSSECLLSPEFRSIAPL